jgi:hypothetical protein
MSESPFFPFAFLLLPLSLAARAIIKPAQREFVGGFRSLVK